MPVKAEPGGPKELLRSNNTSFCTGHTHNQSSEAQMQKEEMSRVPRQLCLIHVNGPETNLQNEADVEIVCLICTINSLKMLELTLEIHLNLNLRSGDEKAENGTVMVEYHN